jgi:hypothetical protein
MITVHSREEYLTALRSFLPIMRCGVEIGVYRGDFSADILRVLRPFSLLLVDPYKESESAYSSGLNVAYATEEDYQFVLERFYEERLLGQVVVIREPSYIAVADVPDKTYNFVYIDGSHLYSDVKRDLNDWLPKLKNGGCLGGHDYAHIADFGVVEAVDEFCAEYGYEMVILNESGGDWALQKAK